MQAATIRRMGVSLAIASLAAGCVQPVYQTPGPIPLLSYPPPVPYNSIPYYREPPPVAVQPTPLPEPMPDPSATPPAAPPDDLGGSIPVQDMPAPAVVTPKSSGDATPDPSATDPAAPAAPAVRKVPTAGTGGNVPLEGFRPMHSQTRPAP